VIDRETWWKPFALSLALIGIVIGGAFAIDFLYRVLAPRKTEEAAGVVLAWGIVTMTFLGLPAIFLLIGGVASLLIQFFRREPPGSILNPDRSVSK
jgi:NO-binding membrane sensor protein with MHYT domain